LLKKFHKFAIFDSDFSDAKSKWRYLRTEFGRQRRKELRGEKELGSDGGVKKPWCYYEALSFLDAFYLDGEFEPSFKVTPNRQQNAPVKRTNNQSEAFEVESAPKISRQREEAELELWARTVAFRVEKFEPFRRVHLRHQIEDLLYNEEIKSMMPMSSENISNYSSYANCSKSDD
jgi:hypothetical protein